MVQERDLFGAPKGEAIDGSVKVEVYDHGRNAPRRPTHLEAYFDQETKKGTLLPLPSCETLAKKWVCVISSKRCRTYSNGGKAIGPLFGIKWLRLYVDEGDTVGNGDFATNMQIVLGKIAAESKWSITGTPVPIKQGNEDKGLKRLKQFLKFTGTRSHREPHGDSDCASLACQGDAHRADGVTVVSFPCSRRCLSNYYR